MSTPTAQPKGSFHSRMTTTARIVFGTSFLFIMLVGLTSSVSLLSFKSRLHDVLAADQKTLLGRIAEDLEHTCQTLESALVQSARTVRKQDIESGDAAQRFLDANTGLAALFDRSTFLFSTEGRIIAEHPYLPNRRGEDVSFRDYIAIPLKEHHPVMSQPFLTTKKDHHVVLAEGVPVYDEQGKVIAVHAGSMGLTKPGILSNIYTTVIGKTGYLFLVAKDGKIIMHPDKTRLLQRAYPVGENSLFEQALAGKDGTAITADVSGRRSLVTYQRIPSTGWVLGAVYPEDEALDDYNTLRNQLIAIIVIACLTAVWGLWWYTQQMLIKQEDTHRELERARALAAGMLQTRSEFFSEASHDFKQRLHALQLLIQATIRSSPNDAPSLLLKAGNAVDGIQAYVRQFLEFTQLETSITMPTLKVTRLQPIFQRLELEFEDDAEQRGVNLKVLYTDLSITTDENMLARILQNLIANAIKFSRNKVLVCARARREAILIEVRDNGEGIAKEDLGKIFEAFQKLDNQHKSDEGVGLGLAICKRLTSTLGYGIHVRSIPEKGTMFQIKIPNSVTI